MTTNPKLETHRDLTNERVDKIASQHGLTVFERDLLHKIMLGVNVLYCAQVVHPKEQQAVTRLRTLGLVTRGISARRLDAAFVPTNFYTPTVIETYGTCVCRDDIEAHVENVLNSEAISEIGTHGMATKIVDDLLALFLETYGEANSPLAFIK